MSTSTSTTDYFWLCMPCTFIALPIFQGRFRVASHRWKRPLSWVVSHNKNGASQHWHFYLWLADLQLHRTTSFPRAVAESQVTGKKDHIDSNHFCHVTQFRIVDVFTGGLRLKTALQKICCVMKDERWNCRGTRRCSVNFAFAFASFCRCHLIRTLFQLLVSSCGFYPC